jgi:hypothetical protein
MSAPQRNPEGGVHDIPRPSNRTASGSKPQFHVGDVVSALDRGNSGEVIAVDSGRVQVRLIDRFNGTESELFFDPLALRLLHRGGEKREITLIDYRALMSLPPARWLVRDVLRCGELACLYGAPGTFKTFVALDIALRVAVGEAWCSQGVERGHVVYVAGEGLYSVAQRTIAWVQQFEDRERVDAVLQDHFSVLGDAVSFLEAEFELLHELLAGLPHKPVLIVVDTLARCAAGGDENSAQDMGLFVRACDRLRKLTGATVLLVHHAGKGDPKQERGSSALRGACDAMFATSVADVGEQIVKLTCEKQKEGEPFAEKLFQLEVVEVGLEHDGRSRCSGRLRLVDRDAPGSAAMNMGNGDDPGVTIQRTLADSFFEDGASGTTLREAAGIPSSTFYRRLTRLVDGGLVERFKRGRHHRFRLLPASQFFVERGAKEGSAIPIPIPTIPTGSHGIGLTQVPDSHSHSHTPPLGGGWDGSENGSADTDSTARQQSEPKPRRARTKRKRSRTVADGSEELGADATGGAQ